MPESTLRRSTASGRALPAAQGGDQVAALGFASARKSERSQHRGDDVDRAHRSTVELPGGEQPWHPQNERNLDRGVVDEDRVGLLAVLAEALAVIGGDHDESSPGEPERVDLVEQDAEPAVGRGDLGVVRRGGAQAVGDRRFVGLVRVEEVDPEKEPPRASLGRPVVQPGGGATGGLGGRPVADHEELRLVLGVEVVVIAVEALVEPETAVEHDRGDESLGVEADGLQAFGEGHRSGAQGVGAVVANPVRGWKEPRQDRRVGGQSNRCGRHRVAAAHAGGCQAVEIGRARRSVAVAAQPVGSQGIDGDEQDVVGNRCGAGGEERCAQTDRDGDSGATKSRPS